jgi:glycosyltransferase involved in cell wall biosynthesis
VGTPSLSIVIPVFNEELEIGRILEATTALLEVRGGEWEVIVVDNASTDGTVVRAAPFVDGERVHMLSNPVNRGKGYSVRRGMLAASGDLRLMCDADCLTSLRSLPQMEEVACRADVVAGSRISDGARVAHQQTLRRRFVGVGFLALSRVMMGQLPRDIYCGFKLWRKDAAQAVFERARLDGWVFDAEVLAMATRMGFVVEEAGIEWSNRDDSRLIIRDVLIPVVGELLKARRNVRSAPTTPPRASADPVHSSLHAEPDPTP